MANLDSNVVRRGVPRVSGIYVKGNIDDVDIFYTVDTGASATLVSNRIIDQLPESKRPILFTENLSKFVGPSGDSIPILGKAVLNLNIGDIHISKSVTVADIHDDCLLGADILLGLEQGPFDFHLSESRLVWNGYSVPCVQVKQPTSCKISCVSDCTISGYSEQIITARIVKETNDEESCIFVGDVLIEPSHHFHDKHKLLMAHSLARVDQSQSVYVRIMNPFPHEVVIRRGEIMGETHPFADAFSLFEEDASVSEQSEESYMARRLHMCSSDERDVPEVINKVELASQVVPSHIQTLYEKTLDNVDESLHDDIASLFHDFGDTFSKDEDDLGCINLTSHEIDTGDARPIKQAPRRTPTAFLGRDKEAIDKMLKRGTIRESNSPWASPVVLVPKKNGSVRVCVDYRKLNDLTKKDAFPLPKISDCLDAVSGSAYFSTLDLTAGYNQVPVAEKDIPKTAFVTKYGLYESPYMPFGLSNAPATFQRVMELALQGL